MLLQHVHFNSLSIENLLRLGRTTLSGPSGDDLHREVEDALTRKRTQSPGTFQSKRRRLQQWSPFLGAILSWNPAGLSASARPVGGGAATGIDDLGLCCYLSISASGEVFVSDCDNQRLVRFQDGSGDLVVGNADVGPLLCTPSGVLYVASRNGRTVAKVVGSTLETVIASETLPVDMQFAACRVFASNFVHQSSWVVGTCCGWPNLNWGPVFPIRPVCNWRWNNLCCWLVPKKGVGLPPRQHKFHRSPAVSRWIAPYRTVGSGQIAVFEYGGAAGNWESVWIFATSWTSARVKKSPAGSRGLPRGMGQEHLFTRLPRFWPTASHTLIGYTSPTAVADWCRQDSWLSIVVVFCSLAASAVGKLLHSKVVSTFESKTLGQLYPAALLVVHRKSYYKSNRELIVDQSQRELEFAGDTSFFSG